MTEILHAKIEAMNFTDATSVKTTLHEICDYFASAIEVDRENPPEPMMDLWHRCDSLNIFDHNQVKMLLKDLVSAINHFHPDSLQKDETETKPEGKPD